MSKQNRRSGKSFSTLGQRMLSFGRGIMRTYANETSLQSDTSSEPSRPQGQWRSMTNKNLIWRQEQATPPTPPPRAIEANSNFDYSDSDYSNYDDMGEPMQRQPQARQPQPIQRQPEPQQPPQSNKPIPSYVKSPDGTPVKVSRKQFPNDLQRRLESISAAHEEVRAQRDKKRDEKVESIQRKVDSGEVTPYRRRGSIDVDYVKTESLLPPEERGKPASPIQTERQDSSSNESSTETTESAVESDADNDSEWFDEIPDDDDNIDSLAGFESSEDEIQRLPDDLPRFDTSSLSQEEASDDMGEFEGGFDSFSSQSANPNTTINRDYDDYAEDSFSDDVPSLFDTSTDSESSVQRFSQELPEFDDGDSDETVPLVPYYSEPTSQQAPSAEPTIQRSELDVPNNDNDMDRPSNDSTVEQTSIQRDMVQRDTFE